MYQHQQMPSGQKGQKRRKRDIKGEERTNSVGLRIKSHWHNALWGGESLGAKSALYSGSYTRLSHQLNRVLTEAIELWLCDTSIQFWKSPGIACKELCNSQERESSVIAGSNTCQLHDIYRSLHCKAELRAVHAVLLEKAAGKKHE